MRKFPARGRRGPGSAPEGSGPSKLWFFRHNLCPVPSTQSYSRAHDRKVDAVVHASIPSPSISYIDIGPLRIHFYALCILTGIVIATWMSSTRLTKRGGTPGMVLDIAMWTVPIGIVGGRLYHVVTHPTDYFFPGADLWKVLFVWEGGLATVSYTHL